MGLLKKDDYSCGRFGITIPTAYARIAQVNVDKDGTAYANFEICPNRECTFTCQPLGYEMVSCKIDKSQPIYEQLYNYAKETIFTDWEDDIVEEEAMVEEEIIMPEGV